MDHLIYEKQLYYIAIPFTYTLQLYFFTASFQIKDRGNHLGGENTTTSHQNSNTEEITNMGLDTA